MRYSGVATLAFASGVAAHTRMYSVWVNGEDQGDGRGVYIRSPPTNDPVKDLTSTSIACNAAGSTAVTDFVSVAAGDSLSFEWYHETRNDEIIASSHLGPIITYIAPYTDGMDGTGSIWTKINEEGYDATSDKWAVDNLISNAGKKDFTVPSGLAAGQYMFRQEIIALHEADTSYVENSARGAQFYPSCVQVEVTGSGAASPSEDYALPGGYTEDDAGIVFNLYGSYDSYPIPGPEVWDGSSSGSATSSVAAAATSTTAAATSAAATTSAAAVTSSTQAAATTSAAAPTQTTLATSVKASTSSAAAAPTSSAPAASGKPSCNKSKKRHAKKHAARSVRH
ncbi:putative Endo-beta-1,4-glucanase D [Seiridium unicorne]|uniref:lytic cellulose monooxygenase (C4-dehydrogenating) n=1 Tax=Seiridium unicorne TaxID=138068 RepID=A0ABR2V9Z7_9PEZI